MSLPDFRHGHCQARVPKKPDGFKTRRCAKRWAVWLRHDADGNRFKVSSQIRLCRECAKRYPESDGWRISRTNEYVK